MNMHAMRSCESMHGVRNKVEVNGNNDVGNAVQSVQVEGTLKYAVGECQ